MGQLKPCPFCGSGAYVQNDDNRFYVACESIDCGCCYGEAWDRDAMPVHQFLNEQDAIAAWNTRPSRWNEAIEAAAGVADQRAISQRALGKPDDWPEDAWNARQVGIVNALELTATAILALKEPSDAE